MPPELAKTVVVPDEAAHVLGELVPGTRLYRAEGHEAGGGAWYEAISEIAGRCVSPGGAGMFAPVSRAAVHKRVKDGNLTAFSFYVTETRKSLFGKQRKAREVALIYVPVCELKLWAEELEERMVKLGKVTAEELEGDKPDWTNDFWKWNAKWHEEQNT